MRQRPGVCPPEVNADAPEVIRRLEDVMGRFPEVTAPAGSGGADVLGLGVEVHPGFVRGIKFPFPEPDV